MMDTEIVIGSDYYCNYKSICEGIEYFQGLPSSSLKKMTILPGIYEETIEIRLDNLNMVGIGEVRIVGNSYAREEYNLNEEKGTFRTATMFIDGENILLENIVIENTAGQGEVVGQAVALFNHGTNIVLRFCKLSAFQDTLCTGPLPNLQSDQTIFKTPIIKDKERHCKQYYEKCVIEGTVDFIFGGAEADFSDCIIHSRKRQNEGESFITAASTLKNQKEGYSFNHCYLTADEGVEKVYLGRPWRPYAKTIFNNCFFGKHIHPDGWDNWGSTDNEETSFYAEINCFYQQEPKRKNWIKFEK